jgi:hypothetical protein
MVPKGVLHKRNGHRQPPALDALAPGDVIRLVHADRSTAPSYELLKFAQVVGSERLDALAAQVTREVDGLRSCLAETLERTREALRAGELADVREALERLRAQAALAARIVTELEAALDWRPPPGGPAGRPRALVDLNQLVAAVLARPGVCPDGVPVVRRLQEGLPRLVADAAELGDALAGALVELAALVPEGVRVIAVETSSLPGPVRGEGTLRLDIRYAGAVPPGLAAGELPGPPGPPGTARPPALRRAARVVAEHGGVTSVAARAGAGLALRLEFPAV